MGTFSKEAHVKSIAMRKKLAKLRSHVATVHQLTIRQLMQKNIQATLAAGKITLQDLPKELWPKGVTQEEVNIPFPPDDVKPEPKVKAKQIKQISTGTLNERQLENLAKLIVAVAKET
jgi:hypothetical protein